MAFTDDAIAAIELHRWSGNVRELLNVVRRAVIMADGGRVTAMDLGLTSPANAADPGRAAGFADVDLRRVREDAERQAILSASPANGILTLKLDGTFTYTPNVNFNGTDSFTYRANDGALNSNVATATITVTPVNDAPVITSNGGGATAAVSIAETITAVTTVTSTDVDGGTPVYSITGGADAAKFTINSSTGALSFLSAPDYEAPTDAGLNNVYDVTVQVSDGSGGMDTQAIAVTVTDAASTLIVTTISDVSDGNVTSLEALNANKGADGNISLREAILAANNAAGLDTITFNIAGAGPHSITVLSALPAITGAVVIDGTTEPDYVTNASRPIVVLDGNNLVADGLVLSGTADGSTIRGLVIRNFGGDAIEIQAGSDGNTIAGNYLGRLNTSGADAGATEANTGHGLNVLGANNTIGGTAAGAGNVISGNAGSGVLITGASATGNLILGNDIGTDATETLDIGNTAAGVSITNAGANIIGGSTLGAGNLIFGNDGGGVVIGGGGAGNNDIFGNQIASNTGHGVLFSNTSANNRVGGTLAGQGNTIASNSGSGVVVYSGSTGTAIRGNAIFSNTGLGIDLSASAVATDGVTANDAGDGDTGGNTLQNKPVLTSAIQGEAVDHKDAFQGRVRALQPVLARVGSSRLPFYEGPAKVTPALASTGEDSAGEPPAAEAEKPATAP